MCTQGELNVKLGLPPPFAFRQMVPDALSVKGLGYEEGPRWQLLGRGTCTNHEGSNILENCFVVRNDMAPLRALCIFQGPMKKITSMERGTWLETREIIEDGGTQEVPWLNMG